MNNSNTINESISNSNSARFASGNSSILQGTTNSGELGNAGAQANDGLIGGNSTTSGTTYNSSNIYHGATGNTSLQQNHSK
jgi:hypothetical protein